MKRLAYVLFSVGLACLAFALVTIATYTPPVEPAGPITRIGNPIITVEGS